jgi:hypothetical protein
MRELCLEARDFKNIGACILYDDGRKCVIVYNEGPADLKKDRYAF